MACISLDWFQLQAEVVFDPTLPPLPLSKNGVFHLVVKALPNRIYSKHLSIETTHSKDREQIAVLSYHPSSPIIPERSAQLKLVNKFLYQDGEDLIRLVNTLLIELNLKFKAVTRYDISYDFKTFIWGKSVPKFFRSVATGKLLKRSCTSLHIDGKTTRKLNIHYMRFGSNQSPVQFYVYNKSKELREVKDKPYIRERWEKNHCSDKHSDTYRIEFVLHPSKFGIVDKATGETLGFDSLLILSNDFQQKIFWVLFQQYFRFVKNDGQLRKDRMKAVKFFQNETKPMLYTRISDKGTSNRVDKMIIKKMYEMMSDWRNEGKEISLEDAINTEVEKNDLSYWVRNYMNTQKVNTKLIYETFETFKTRMEKSVTLNKQLPVIGKKRVKLHKVFMAGYRANKCNTVSVSGITPHRFKNIT